MQKPRLAALFGTSRKIGIKAGLRGWRCSAGSRRSPAGNFAKFGLQDESEMAVRQPFHSLFPTQNSREKIRMIREIFQNNRE